MPKNAIIERGPANDSSFDVMLGRRVRTAREEASMSQEALSGALGFENRQVLSNIESGKRKLGVDELLKLMQLLRKELEYFTDPLRLVGEAISWRANVKAQNIISKYEPHAGGIVAAYRAFAKQLGENPSAPHVQLSLRKRSSLEEAESAAEKLAADWQLSDVPARALPNAIEQRLGVPVLVVDASQAISGAASKLQDLSVILINRNEPEYRRNYDLAHELFHILTWQAMPPDPLDATEKKSRVETLADAFAAALLMPRSVLNPLWSARGKRDLHAWINATAREIGVSGQALFYRLKALGWIATEEELRIDFERLKWHGREQRESDKPQLYSPKFVEMLHRMLDAGWISVRRAAVLLNCTVEDLVDLFRSYGKKAPFPS